MKTKTSDVLNVAPKVFISYAHENDEHKLWVLNLAKNLRANGVDAILDRWEIKLGSDTTHFMENGIQEADKVLLICTPKYCNKTKHRVGGVGYENTVITGELVGKHNTHKFVCVLKSGSSKTSIPSYCKSRLYIDFRVDEDYPSSFDQLLRDILDVPDEPKPPLKESPFLSEVVYGDNLSHYSETDSKPSLGKIPFKKEILAISNNEKTDLDIATENIPIPNNTSINTLSGYIFYINIKDFTLMNQEEQVNSVQTLWKYLDSKEFLNQKEHVYINGAGDSVIIAILGSAHGFNHLTTINLADSFISDLSNISPNTKLRIGLHQGPFNVIPVKVLNDSQIIGTGPNLCSRLLVLGDEGDIIVSEDFVNGWHNEQGDKILNRFIPNTLKSPIEVFIKHNQTIKARIYRRKNAKKLSNRLSSLQTVESRLYTLLEEIEKQLIAGLSAINKKYTQKNVSARISILAPHKNNLISTKYRWHYRQEKTLEGETTYKIKGKAKGPAGKAFTGGKPYIIKGLPNWNGSIQDKKKYVKILQKTGLSKSTIEKFGRRSRAFIDLPAGLEEKKHDLVICIDTDDPLTSVPMIAIKKIAQNLMKDYCELITALWRLRIQIY